MSIICFTRTHALFCTYRSKKQRAQFRQLETDFPDVYFQSNYRITWGGIEHLKAILQLLDKSMEFDYKYVHIISGEDYPLKTIDEIEDYFENNDKIYSNYSFIDTKKHPGARRYQYYWPYVKYSMNYKKQYIRIFNLFFVMLQVLFPFWNKNKVGEITKIYWGFVWGSYPKQAIEYVLNYLNIHQEFWKDLTTCKIPEELCFQTILIILSLKIKWKITI